ncbi:hypothetical protein ACTFIU_009288 [Dictyostelium citrinum]
MPKIKTSKKKYPKGWDIISSTLEEFDLKMREAEANPHEGKRKCEANWPIFRIHHQRSRYLYEKFYKNKEISRDLYEFCLREGYADKNLIAKWKKVGYERLCCLKCIQDLSHVCICRVPLKELDKGIVLECVSCGCKGCASGGGSISIKKNKKNNNSNDDDDDDGGDDNDGIDGVDGIDGIDGVGGNNKNNQEEEEENEENEENEEKEKEKEKEKDNDGIGFGKNNNSNNKNNNNDNNNNSNNNSNNNNGEIDGDQKKRK